MASIEVHSGSILHVAVSSSVTSFVSERRFDKSLAVGEVMQKLELITGSMSQYMELEVYSEDNKFLFKLDDRERMIGSYQIDDGMRINVVDKNPQGAESFTDISKVEKYEMSSKDYDSRGDTVRSFLKRKKLGKFDPQEQNAQKEVEKERLAEDADALTRVKVGLRCQVSVPGQMLRRGAVRYVGFTEFKPHVWVGVQYDEPYGKNNGTVQGKSYFECTDKYGAFVRPKHVQCGDFPEEGFDDSDPDEM
ncbi:tubulin-folding cofactor B-like [Clavelina lepadiformis]|uniref:tubulin-folding cofactor B-like n=1 Tax=Clavelina lepadiformis TaxID=159417 RepID=UPI0040438C8B